MKLLNGMLNVNCAKVMTIATCLLWLGTLIFDLPVLFSCLLNFGLFLWSILYFLYAWTLLHYKRTCYIKFPVEFGIKWQTGMLIVNCAAVITIAILLYVYCDLVSQFWTCYTCLISQPIEFWTFFVVNTVFSLCMDTITLLKNLPYKLSCWIWYEMANWYVDC